MQMISTQRLTPFAAALACLAAAACTTEDTPVDCGEGTELNEEGTRCVSMESSVVGGGDAGLNLVASVSFEGDGDGGGDVAAREGDGVAAEEVTAVRRDAVDDEVVLGDDELEEAFAQIENQAAAMQLEQSWLGRAGHFFEPVFRPPSEANSLILQVTIGCSWNQCTFCEMYTQPQKRFRFKPIEKIELEVAAIARSGALVRRIFLADGDAMTLSVRRLKEILSLIKVYYPNVQRVSSYCLPRNLKKKTAEE